MMILTYILQDGDGRTNLNVLIPWIYWFKLDN